MCGLSASCRCVPDVSVDGATAPSSEHRAVAVMAALIAIPLFLSLKIDLPIYVHALPFT